VECHNFNIKEEEERERKKRPRRYISL